MHIYILYLNPPLPPNAKVGPLQLPLGDLVLYGIDLLVPWKSSDARRARAMACQGPLHDPVRHFRNPCPVLAAHDGHSIMLFDPKIHIMAPRSP